MWYLIVPPLVFIGSLALLIWFFSKKSADPNVQERIETGEGMEPKQHRYFFFIKEETGLRFLEKMTQRLKLLALKFHNRFNQFSEAVRTRRKKLLGQDEKPVTEEGAEPKIGGENFWDRWQRRHTKKAERVSEPETEKREAASEREETATPVPIVSNTALERGKSWGSAIMEKGQEATRVFRRRRVLTSTKKRLSEEELIDRIARNPKDASAYEELGDFYMDGSNLSDAKACYRQVIKLLPLNREVKEKVRRLERLLAQKERNGG